jgi:hypothetical protein
MVGTVPDDGTNVWTSRNNMDIRDQSFSQSTSALRLFAQNLQNRGPDGTGYRHIPIEPGPWSCCDEFTVPARVLLGASTLQVCALLRLSHAIPQLCHSVGYAVPLHESRILMSVYIEITSRQGIRLQQTSGLVIRSVDLTTRAS